MHYRPVLSEIDDLYGSADVLSIKNAKKHQKILLGLSVLGTLLTMFFLLYDEAELHGLIVACIVMIIFLFLTREFLIENSAGYSYQTKNKPDLVY